MNYPTLSNAPRWAESCPCRSQEASALVLPRTTARALAGGSLAESFVSGIRKEESEPALESSRAPEVQGETRKWGSEMVHIVFCTYLAPPFSGRYTVRRHFPDEESKAWRGSEISRGRRSHSVLEPEGEPEPTAWLALSQGGMTWKGQRVP